jgi:hypothetical protein
VKNNLKLGKKKWRQGDGENKRFKKSFATRSLHNTASSYTDSGLVET